MKTGVKTSYKNKKKDRAPIQSNSWIVTRLKNPRETCQKQMAPNSMKLIAELKQTTQTIYLFKLHYHPMVDLMIIRLRI